MPIAVVEDRRVDQGHDEESLDDRPCVEMAAVPLPRPGYFACSRVLERIRRLQDLIRHHQRWAHQCDLARPLEELLPPGTKPEHERVVLEQEINRLLPLVHHNLNAVGIDTRASVTEEDAYYDKVKERAVQETKEIQRYDQLLNYFEIRRQYGGHAWSFDLLLHVLERGIGVFEAYKSAAVRELMSPLSWVAWSIRLPLTLLERAELAEQGTPSLLVKGYGWIVRMLMLGLLFLVSARLGTTIPWDNLRFITSLFR
jgi:hypothetical protein